jgi:phosphatidylinositol glycan class H protein
VYPGTFWYLFKLWSVGVSESLCQESVVVLPPHGIQLETHRGLPWFSPLVVKRQFIPFASLRDFVIHEGLRKWDVRYYLAAIKLSDSGDFQVHVAFEVGFSACERRRVD